MLQMAGLLRPALGQLACLLVAALLVQHGTPLVGQPQLSHEQDPHGGHGLAGSLWGIRPMIGCSHMHMEAAGHSLRGDADGIAQADAPKVFLS